MCWTCLLWDNSSCYKCCFWLLVIGIVVFSTFVSVDYLHNMVIHYFGGSTHVLLTMQSNPWLLGPNMHRPAPLFLCMLVIRITQEKVNQETSQTNNSVLYTLIWSAYHPYDTPVPRKRFQKLLLDIAGISLQAMSTVMK